MAERLPQILLCSCDDTMSLDGDCLRRACRGAAVKQARRLCRDEIESFKAAAAFDSPLLVGCTQEAPLFRETAVAAGADPVFVNLRETAGWSDEGDVAAPKIAALIAMARVTAPAAPLVNLISNGVILVYGRGQTAIEAATLLRDRLDVTVVLTDPAESVPQRVGEFAVAKGRIRSAAGHLGAFDIILDDFALSLPWSRGALEFTASRDGVKSRCDLVLDISGDTALFPAADLRDGYMRADPRDPAAVLRMVLKARDLTGRFDKPRYIAFAADQCAHSRSHIVGCRRCLDLCPTGAIAPAGDHVAIDAAICAGCGQCAAACPTGAASYALPPADILTHRLRALLTTFREAGGKDPILLVHDAAHGSDLIAALARYGAGLPAGVLPVEINEVTQVGLEIFSAAFAYGASHLRVLTRARPRHDIDGLRQSIALAQPILAALGFGSLATIETDDPDILGATLRAIPAHAGSPRPATFVPVGGKREALRLSLRELRAAAPTPAEVIALPAGAPLGSVEINAEGCTLCLACVAACPTGALGDDGERPLLRFVEDACVQCGLCRATCPEKVITLVPRIDFRAAFASARVLKEEEPFLCIKCGKPFGVKSTIERIVQKLAGRHWIYADNPERADLLKMCDACRVAAVAATEFDPHAAPLRPAARTTEDYLRAREDRQGTDDNEENGRPGPAST